MTDRISSIGRQLLHSVVHVLDKMVESPPPDKYDILIVAPELFPTLGVPLPDDPVVLKAISDSLGKPVDEERVDDFLKMVWEHDSRSDIVADSNSPSDCR